MLHQDTLHLRGPNATFDLPTDLAVNQASYIKHALLQQEPGSTGLAITFDDVDADTLELFVQWLWNPARMRFATNPDDHCMQLARLYAFGDRIAAPALQYEIVSRFYEIVNAGGTPDLRVVSFVFNNEHIPSGSPLRKFMIQWCVWRLQPDWHLHNTVREALQLLPELTVDLLAEMHRGEGPFYQQSDDRGVDRVPGPALWVNQKNRGPDNIKQVE